MQTSKITRHLRTYINRVVIPVEGWHNICTYHQRSFSSFPSLLKYVFLPSSFFNLFFFILSLLKSFPDARLRFPTPHLTRLRHRRRRLKAPNFRHKKPRLLRKPTLHVV